MDTIPTEKVYQTIEKPLPFKKSKYFTYSKELKQLLAKGKFKKVVEVGSWYGNSTIFLAKNTSDDAKIYAIDSWIGYPKEIYGTTYNIFEQFLSNVIQKGVSEKIIPLRNTSITAFELFKECIGEVDLVVIDGDGSFEGVYCDIRLWGSLLGEGGAICGPIRSQQTLHAIKQFYSLKAANLEFTDKFWICRKI
ncbi:MAG: class I SAM-dependent methyltransferase [Simkaniaceae bacterium]|nr:class I SAM-dependent methyltransferase [Simkaniaceae bacterium]